VSELAEIGDDDIRFFELLTPIDARGHADAAAATSETVVNTPADYFPAQFPAPKGEPEAHVETF